MKSVVYKRIYRAKCGDKYCFSTNVKDIDAFLHSILLVDAARFFARVEFEVVSIKR